jgi:hypothetical protein
MKKQKKEPAVTVIRPTSIESFNCARCGEPLNWYIDENKGILKVEPCKCILKGQMNSFADPSKSIFFNGNRYLKKGKYR